MTFYKVQQNHMNASSNPHWVTKDENKYGEIWVNLCGGWCLKYEDDEILAIDEAIDKDDFIERNRKEIYSYMIKPDSDLGWLAPDGTFYGCNWAEHELFVNEYFGKTDLEMEKDGYLRIFRSAELGVPVYSQFKISTAQRVWLEDHNVEFNYC